jgi:hypothetical protein
MRGLAVYREFIKGKTSYTGRRCIYNKFLVLKLQGCLFCLQNPGIINERK